MQLNKEHLIYIKFEILIIFISTVPCFLTNKLKKILYAKNINNQMCSLLIYIRCWEVSIIRAKKW